MLKTYIQWQLIPLFHVLDQDDNVECTLSTTPPIYDHHDAVNKIIICLKLQHHVIPASIIEYTPLSDVESRVVEAMITELTV